MQFVIKEPLGDKLVQCIQEGIAFSERHKGRARLVKKAPTRTLTAARIESDVQSAIARLERPTEPLHIPNFFEELLELADQAELGELVIEGLSNRIWALLDIDDPAPYATSRERQMQLANLMRNVAEEERVSPGYALQPRRGRKSDFVLYAFVSELAVLYEAYSGFAATATQCKDGSGMKSPFYSFLTIILRHFPDHPKFIMWLEHDGTLARAINQVIACKEVDDSDPNDLAIFFEENPTYPCPQGV